MIIRITIVFLFVFGAAGCQPTLNSQPFVHDDFVVPSKLETDEFTLLPIKEAYAKLDFDAVMASAIELRVKFGDGWPPRDFSVEQNRKEIAIHVEQFRNRNSFTFSVFTPDRTRILGCVYIVPGESSNLNAKIIYWIRTDEKNAQLDAVFRKSLTRWLDEEWKFSNYGF